MTELYHKLTPEETIEVSDLILSVGKRIYGNNYVDDLSIRIEREQGILARSLALAQKSEFSRLLTTADTEFYRSFTLFADLVNVKEQITMLPDEHCISKAMSVKMIQLVHDWDTLSREELLAEVENMVEELDSCEIQNALTREGIMPLFNDLKSKFLVLRGLTNEAIEIDSEVPPPSIASRRLAITLSDLHTHVAGYSRLGNREYKALLEELEKRLEETVVAA